MKSLRTFVSVSVLVLVFTATFQLLPVKTVEADSPWQGTVTASNLNVRSAPNTSSAAVSTVKYGETVTVISAVTGEPVLGQNIWYQIGPNQYVYGNYVSRGNPAEIDYGPGERWIDVDVSKKVARAMVGETAVYTADVTVGREGWKTPAGTFGILRRVESEIMDSATIDIPRDSPDGYYLTGVLYTQYFLPTGQALHYNYWVPDEAFGNAASSRGCIGLRLADAKFFWDFAELGTPVVVHY